MNRSWDHRKQSTPDTGTPSLRGSKRLGPIRGIVPGDHGEVARDIARLWEWHLRLERGYKKWVSEYGTGTPFGCFYSKVMDEEDPNLVAFWDAQDEAGGMVDKSGSGRDAPEGVGTTSAHFTYGAAGAFPAEATLTAIDLAPTTQQTSTDTFAHFAFDKSDFKFENTDNMTVEALINLDDSTPTTKLGIICARDSSGNGWSFEITSGGYLQFRRQGTTTTDSSTPLSSNQWYHVAATFNGTQVRLYVNGQQVVVKNDSGNITGTGDTYGYIGRVKDSTTNYYLDGTIGGVIVWSNAQTQAELSARAICLTQTGSGGLGDLSLNPDGEPAVKYFTATGTGGSGTAPGSGIIGPVMPVARYKYWYDRGWRLYARGAFNSLAVTGTNQIKWVGIWPYIPDGTPTATVPLHTFAPRLHDTAVVTGWTQVAPNPATYDDDDTWTFYAFAGTDSGIFDWDAGANTVEMIWVDTTAGTIPLDSVNVQSGTADNQILYWDSNIGNWIPGSLTNAMVDASAAIAYSKLNLTGNIVNADINASAAIVYSKLSLSNSLVGSDWSTTFADALQYYKVKHDIISKGTGDSPYSVGSGDDVILASGAAGALTINLPASSTWTGRVLTVKVTSVATGNITIAANGAETIDGAGSITLTAQYDVRTLLCDGSNWHIIGN